MQIIRRLILALALMAGLAPAFAQAPPPVPALPDTERRTSYTISGTTCACAVNFALYGDSTDYQDWLEVYLNGVRVNYNDPALGWTITSPTGPLATIPRPITDAVLTFSSVQTGTVQIIGARRPRRVSQFSENRGVAARDLNQALTDIIAQNRENWDRTNDVTGRAVLAHPGETLALLPLLAARLNQGACFDSGGNLTTCVSVPSSTFTAGSGIIFTGINPTVMSAAVPSVFGRTGAIVGANGDYNAGQVTYTPVGTGAVVQTVNSKLNLDFLHVKEFGVVGDNSTDDTTALQNWLNACATNRLVCYLDPPSVCYKITAALTVNSANGITITGPGRDKVGQGICLSSTTQNGIVATTLGQVNLFGFAITGQAAATAGDMFQLNSGVGGNPNQRSTMRDMYFQSGFQQAHYVSASGWTIDNCLFVSPHSGGTSVVVEDTAIADAGDQAIQASTFSGSATGTAILQTSGGGLKVVGNKIINYANGYILSLASGVSTSDLFFSANSMEAFVSNGISLTKNAGTTFGTVVINGNEINGCSSCFNTDTNASWLNNVIVSNNHLSPNAAGTCMDIGTGSGVQVIGNNCQAGGAGATGIVIRANVSSGLVSDNIFNSNVATLYSFASSGVKLLERNGSFSLISSLTTIGNGSQVFVSDGATATSPCTGSGTGSMAFRQNNAWKCF